MSNSVVADPLTVLLYALGVGFLGANVVALGAFVRYYRRRPTAVLTWQLPRPRMHILFLVVAAGLVLVIVYKTAVLNWPLWRVFGEAMMLAYYGASYPLGLGIRRGIYRDGIWMDRSFVRWAQIGGASWREDPEPTLVAIAKARQTAWRLAVPPEHYAEARRLLRDHVRSHDLHLDGVGLHLDGHDERDDL